VTSLPHSGRRRDQHGTSGGFADIDLDALTQNRINGTTIPLYDKMRQVYQDTVEIVSAHCGPAKA